MAVKTIRIKGWEADDLIYAVLAFCGGNTTVVSDDKDMLQLIHEWKEEGECGSISVYRPSKEHHINCRNFEELVGYPQSQFLIRKSILGDKSDDIPGIPGVGPTTVNTIYDDGAPVCPPPFEDLFLYCESHKSKRVHKISANIDIVMRNWELINLVNEDVSSVEKQLRGIAAAPVIVDLPDVKRFLSELDLFSIVRDLHSWIIPYQRLR
jgi:DNA polymerase-1